MKKYTETLVDQECIRNGGFNQDKSAWATNPIGTHVGDGYGKTGAGMGMQVWPEFTDGHGFIWQELYLPTRTASATLAFDFKFLPQAGAALGGLRAHITSDTEDLATPLYIDTRNYPGESWQTLRYTLTGAELSALNAAHDVGKRVYVVIDLHAQFLFVNVDNVSFKVSGNMDYPALAGSIAYIGLDDTGYAKTVKRIEPDGSAPRTVWTHPITGHIHDVAWKPDSGEIAFSSNHEAAYSAFHSDVYGIRPDGSGLRRITNPPSKAEIDAGGYQLGTVTGQILNNYGRVTLFQLYIEGAADAISLDVGTLGDKVSFTIPNVADLGIGSHYVVFTWTRGSKVNCKEYAATVVDVTPGGTVDAGTITFGGICGTYRSQSISWNGDGTQVAVDIITPKTFQATGEAIGVDLFSAPLTANAPAWSPMDNRILYHNWIISGSSGLYLTTKGGDAGTWLVNDGGAAPSIKSAWLPDGSGFVYALNNCLYECRLSGSEVITLATFQNEFVDNPCVSPDGQYVAFERQPLGVSPLQYNLWVLNRRRPVELWPLTTDGRSMNPDWSRRDPD